MQMRHELFKMHKEFKATFVYVTHDQVEALSLGDRIVVLKDGEIQQVGSPEEIYNQPANTFVASFIGSPGTNLLDLDGNDHLLGIRPEFLHLESEHFDSKFEILVNNIEMLGAEYLIYGVLDEASSKLEKTLLAKVPNTVLSTEIYQKFLNSKEKLVLPLHYSRSMLYYFNRLNEENAGFMS
jgi:ABC-type sugar transport system ATPase subunit